VSQAVAPQWARAAGTFDSEVPVDLKTAGALRRLRLISAPEAVSFLLLLVCSVLKRTTDFNAVPAMGMIHGVLFILYVLFWADSWRRARWGWQRGALYFVLSVLPTGGFFAERMLRRECEASVLAARAAQTPEAAVGA
jgi:integral membrane protein